ncbi:MAG: pyridoxal-phosphate dependent enzyme, partial [Hyphomicrobiaceae bacterium]
MISRANIERAKSRIGSHLRSTPVLQVEAGTLCDGGPLALKLEQLQPTGSFKLRGAFNAMLTKTPPKAGVVAFSGGNHGAAVAYAATKLGLRSTIFVPEFAGPVKIARMRSFGAEVIVPGNDVDAILAQYAEHAERTGALSIHPYDDLDVIC